MIAGLFYLAAMATAHAEAICMTMVEARKAYPTSYLVYRRIDGDRCWRPQTKGAPAARPLWPVRLPISRPIEVTPQQRIDAAFGGFILIDFDPPGWATIRDRQAESQ